MPPLPNGFTAVFDVKPSYTYRDTIVYGTSNMCKCFHVVLFTFMAFTFALELLYVPNT